MNQTIKTQGLDMEQHRSAVRALSDRQLNQFVTAYRCVPTRSKDERLRLKAAKEELERRKGKRR